MSIYLRLAAPVQSWSAHKLVGTEVSTEPIPTRSGVLGLLAAALGAPIGEHPQWLSQVKLSVRVDDRGEVFDDIQVISSRIGSEVASRDPLAMRYFEVHKVSVSKEKKHSVKYLDEQTGASWMVPVGKGNALVHRTYLGGSVFLVEVNAGDREEELLAALERPRFSPYLGRKSFAPTFPFVLGAGEEGLLEALPTYGPGGKLEVHALKSRRSGWYVPEQRVEVENQEFGQWLDSVKAALARR